MREALKKSEALVGIVQAARKIPRDWKRLQAAARRKQQIAHYLSSHQKRGLQIGSGHNDLEGWLNTEYNPFHPGQVFLDATEQYPMPDDSFDYVYSEHMIEHIPWRAGQAMLRQCFRVLKPGGTIRISTPNLANICSLSTTQPDARQRNYIKQASDKHCPDNEGYLGGFVINNFYWDFGHYFIYDPTTMRYALERCGYTNIRTMKSGHSEVDALRNIENHGRVVGADLDEFETFITEADKPSQAHDPVTAPLTHPQL